MISIKSVINQPVVKTPEYSELVQLHKLLPARSLIFGLALGMRRPKEGFIAEQRLLRLTANATRTLQVVVNILGHHPGLIIFCNGILIRTENRRMVQTKKSVRDNLPEIMETRQENQTCYRCKHGKELIIQFI